MDIDFQDCARQLLDAPSPSLPKPASARGRLSKEEQAQLDAMLWAGIDAADPVATKRALEEGANPKRKRNGYPPFWIAVQANRYDIAQILLDAGADPHARGRSNQSVSGAIAPRNDPKEAERLLEMIKTPTGWESNDFLMSKAHLLLEWWLQKSDRAPTPVNSRWSGRNMNMWIIAALDGPGYIMARLNEKWKLDPTKYCDLTRLWGASMAREAWNEIAKRDDVALAKRALAHGWGPPFPADFTKEDLADKEVSNVWALDTGWMFFHKRSLNLFSWWMSVDALARHFERTALANLDILAEVLSDIPSIELAHKLGLGQFLHRTDEQGNLLAHYLFRSPKLSKKMITWWHANHPEQMHAKNHMGQTPLDQDHANPTMAKMLAHAKGHYLQLASPKAEGQAKARRL